MAEQPEQHELTLDHYNPESPIYLGTSERYQRSFEYVYTRAISFLEANCDPDHGIYGELHHHEKEHESCYEIPTSFESALLLPFLREEKISSSTLNSLVNAVKLHRRETGFWAYFDPLDESQTAMFPDDIETTSVSMLALYLAGEKTKEECQASALKVIEYAVKDEANVLGTWLANLEPRKILYEKLLYVPKPDANCLANALCYFSIIGLAEDRKYENMIKPNVEFVAEFVNKLWENRGNPAILEEMLYYPNRIPIYFVLARYAFHSPTAKQLFGEKLKSVVKAEILGVSPQWEKGMNLACYILAALYLNLHREDGKSSEVDNAVGEVRKKMQRMFDMLLALQLDDGSYEKAVLYKMTHFGHYGGSKCVSTAFVISAIGRYQRQVLEELENPNQI